jgi:lysyl-tRNA synthetase class 2
MREFTEQEQVRRDTLEEMRGLINPYPERFERNYEIKDAANLEDGVTGVRVAGRIVLMRKMGKMAFLTIQDIGGRIQLSIKIDMVGEEKYELFKKYIDLGDFIGVEGEVFTTHTGEKTIRANSFEFLGKALKPLPEKFHGLNDIETVYRNRYLDLITSEESRRNFIFRSNFIKELRNHLSDQGYLEIETPILNNKASAG